jgi:hypothetical protein
MAYKYDIFLSVKWAKTFDEWVTETFLPLFESYVRQEIFAQCGREPVGSRSGDDPPSGIFYYKKSLAPGDPWPNDLDEAIRTSRIAVALCSPEYFYSKWCLTEFHSFLERARKNQARVLVPVTIYDGKTFPSEVQNIQESDLANFVIVGPGFKETKSYVKFQKALQMLSNTVGRLVCNAPQFAEWPVVRKWAPGEEPTVEQKTL